MHSCVEEVEPDPCCLFISLGTIIVEGRILDLGEKCVEGPHCPPVYGQNKHVCDGTIVECQQNEILEKHMLLLWKNSIPVSIEVLLYPECCENEGKPKIEISSVPETSCILLEQWIVHMLPKRVADSTITPHGLVQAVRSFLHFSQLSSWYSFRKNKLSLNIHYRICVPGEEFSCKFVQTPDIHSFPIANIDRCAMKVTAKVLPRLPNIPVVVCEKHSPPTSSKEIVEKSGAATAKTGEISGETVRSLKELCSDTHSRKTEASSPLDLQLGESLLDPPQSLQMYPKRYQSPSRSGSPSIEVPEKLLFGKCAKRRESESKPSKERICRPHRRPVIERFLNKDTGKDDGILPEPVHECLKLDENVSGQPSYVTDYYASVSTSELPIDEVTAELSRLRSRYLPAKHCHKKQNIGDDSPNMQVFSSTSKWELGKKESLPRTSTPCKNKANKAADDSFTADGYFLDQSPLHDDLDQSSGSISKLNSSAVEECSQSKKSKCSSSEGYVTSSYTATSPLSLNISDDISVDSKKFSTSLFFKSDSISQTSCKSKGLGTAKTSPLVQHSFSSFGEDGKAVKDKCNYTVPSASDRAKFRRSLDSATSMVFHQKTLLPLTSSPAPIRKSGTCFDFDSSLTSISAIKRALFEKDPETEVEDPQNLSASAPVLTPTSNLLGSFEESVLNGRLEPVSTVEGFTAEIGASGSFCPRHITPPVTVFFYSFHDTEKVASPYLGHIYLGLKGYHIPKKGTIQLTLFNPLRTVIKMFVVQYDFTDMPINSQTFLRQRTLFMPTDATENHCDAQKWLRYLIHLRFSSSKSGRVFLHKDIRIVIFRKHDLDAANIHALKPYELRSFTHGPTNPKYSQIK